MRKLFSSLLHNWSQPKYHIAYTEDVPTVFKPLTVYIIGLRTEPWQAAFICPCGCNAIIQLNLLREASPRWKVYTKRNKVTLYPSINRRVGCKSHFYIRKGKVIWAFDD